MSLLEGYRGQHDCIVYGAEEHGAIPKSFSTCKRNPGHTRFMTIKEFQESGPSNFAHNPTELDAVWSVIKRTVRIKVSYTSERRPDTYPRSNISYPLREIRGSRCHVRCGTGFLHYHDDTDKLDKIEPCPCLDCKKKKTKSDDTDLDSDSDTKTTSPTFCAYFKIETATHVLFDSSEAQHAVFEFFYDSEDRADVKCVYGLSVVDDDEKESSRYRLESDMCRVLCVTHDEELAGKLWEIRRKGLNIQDDIVLQAAAVMDTRPEFKIGSDLPSGSRTFMVSHPHGVSKRISFGNFTGDQSFLMNEKESPIILKKGLKLRISGKLDNHQEVVKVLNLKLDDGGRKEELKPAALLSSSRTRASTSSSSSSKRRLSDTIICCTGRRRRVHHYDDKDNVDDDDGDEDGGSDNANTNTNTSVSADNGGPKTFRMLSDVTMCSPLPIVIQCDGEYVRDKWWTLPPDVQLATKDNNGGGTSVTIPARSSTDNERVRLEVYIEGIMVKTPFLRYDDDDEATLSWQRHDRHNYNMAACPGSSGAMLPYRFWLDTMFIQPSTHFGCVGPNNKNTSGLG